MSPLHDLRQYHPLRAARPLAFLKPVFKPVLRPQVTRPTAFVGYDATKGKLPAKIAFTDPRRMVICLKRRIRREVIHALGRGGGGGKKKGRRNQWSDVSC